MSSHDVADQERGRRIEELREELDLTKGFLARSLGTQTSQITNWENGKPI